MSSSELPEYAVRNRASWTKSNEDYTHEQGVRAWRLVALLTAPCTCAQMRRRYAGPERGAALEEVRVRAEVRHAPLIQDENGVAVDKGGEAV